jgi:hypothetical protein
MNKLGLDKGVSKTLVKLNHVLNRSVMMYHKFFVEISPRYIDK